MEKQANQVLTNSIRENLNLMSIIKGIIVSYIITIPAFIVFSFILTYTDFPEKYIRTVVLITTIMSVLVAGSVVIKNIKNRGWLNGAFVGLIYILILYVFSSIVFRDFSIDKNVISMTAIGTISGSIGGIVGINIQANSHSKRRIVRR